MKRKYGIGILLFSVLLIYFISYGAYHEYTNRTEDSDNFSMPADGQAFDEHGFYLYEVNGYVVVFKNDKMTPYEYTTISYDTLPEIIKQEIKNGKYIKNEEELYGFLENYTS